MRDQKLIFLAINILANVALAGDITSWIKSGPTMDGSFYYVVCSSSGLDSQEIQELTESKCLASAAKLGPVTVTVKSKTVQSLTGADSSEVAELEPLIKTVNCEPTKRHLEKVGEGFRLWLQCRVKKSDLNRSSGISRASLETKGTEALPHVQKAAYKRGLLTVITRPKADVLIVGGPSGQRAIDVNSNSMTIEINQTDEWLTARKHGYQDQKKKMDSWKHGDSTTLNFGLQKVID